MIGERVDSAGAVGRGWGLVPHNLQGDREEGGQCSAVQCSGCEVAGHEVAGGCAVMGGVMGGVHTVNVILESSPSVV